MTKPPYFSIVIPTFNRGHLIKRAVDSALNQSYSDFEVIVVDDGSTDDTEMILGHIKDPRFFYLKQANGERGKARNVGIRIAKGRYVSFLDSDDIIYPNHFEEAVRVIEKHKDPEFFHLAYQIVDTGGHVINKPPKQSGNLNLKLLEGNFLSCLGVFVRSDIIKKHMFSENRHMSGSEDWELWMRLASRYKLHCSNIITGALVQHSARSVLSVEPERLIRRIELVRKSLAQDPEFQKMFGRFTSRMNAHLDLYLSLHLILGGYRTKSVDFLKKGLKRRWRVLWDRKTASIIYKLTKSALS